MIKDNMKRLRINARMSQEELAVRLSVVRQTVSKWENGLSVPDAENVIKIAELYHVSVNELLGVDVDDSAEYLTKELAKANEQLAEKIKTERNIKLANKKRGLILLLCFISMIFALIIKNQIVSISSIGICCAVALMILYRNLTLLTSITTNDIKIRSLKITTIFNVVILLCAIAAAVLIRLDVINISDNGGKIFAMVLISIVIIFSGIISPKLPFNRHTGLRLPWTVQDEDTWNVAHRVINFTALPVALLYIIGTCTLDNFEAVSLIAIIGWIGFPALISFVYYYKKTHGKL